MAYIDAGKRAMLRTPGDRTDGRIGQDRQRHITSHHITLTDSVSECIYRNTSCRVLPAGREECFEFFGIWEMGDGRYLGERKESSALLVSGSRACMIRKNGCDMQRGMRGKRNRMEMLCSVPRTMNAS